MRNFLLRATAITNEPGGVPLDFLAPVNAAEASTRRMHFGGGSLDVSPFTLECSARFSPGHLERRRYTTAVAASQLGAHPFGAMKNLLTGLHPPLGAIDWMRRLRDQGHLPSSVITGVSWSRNPAQQMGKLYLEQRPLESVLGLPPSDGSSAVPSMLSLEWPLAGGPPILRRYHELPDSPSPADPAVWLGPNVSTELLIVIRDLVQGLDHRFAYGRTDSLPKTERGAQAVHYIIGHVPLSDAASPLARMARLLGVDGTMLSSWLSDVPDALLRVVSAGEDASGESHVTLYYGPPDPGARAAQMAGGR
jgi:hypothetical protein